MKSITKEEIQKYIKEGQEFNILHTGVTYVQ